MNNERSEKLFQHAKEVIPGGVNSPVRACRSVGRNPVFIDRAEGCMLYDADGNAYIDYVGSWGPMILGHRHPAVVSAVKATLGRGTSFGAPTDLEIELAEMVIAAVPSIDTVRFVNSGTEATMSAIRLARGITGRDLIVKFDGCYHGHADTLLVEAGSGVATLGIPGSPGVPDAFAAYTISLPFNDLDAVEKVMAERGADVACIIVEPVAGNMGLVLPEDGYLAGLRAASEKAGSLLIFDEVITGFRVSLGGAQAHYGVMPDLTTLGKIIGGGMPVGAYGGRKELMDRIAPDGPIYQAGTLSGNPLAMAAGIATLTELNKPGVYAELAQKTEYLTKGLKEAARSSGIPVEIDSLGSVFGMFFNDQAVRNMADAKTSDLNRFSMYYNAMLENGIYVAPSQFESGFVSTAHKTEQLDKTIKTAKAIFDGL
ncbi:MAG: glutamate-1-semialdehyde 2,1-aminomutase [Deltaproteobacteria bacterium]|nr:glutamate-1-semialdehyde 2,1-aminomutase [Deltaproteobacteria bacterium]